jgi:hypothetical protein
MCYGDNIVEDEIGQTIMKRSIKQKYVKTLTEEQ